MQRRPRQAKEINAKRRHGHGSDNPFVTLQRAILTHRQYAPPSGPVNAGRDIGRDPVLAHRKLRGRGEQRFQFVCQDFPALHRHRQHAASGLYTMWKRNGRVPGSSISCAAEELSTRR